MRGLLFLGSFMLLLTACQQPACAPSERAAATAASDQRQEASDQRQEVSDQRQKAGQLPIIVRHELSLGEDGRWRATVIAAPGRELPAMSWRLSHLERAVLVEGAAEGSEAAWPACEERRWSYAFTAEPHVAGTDAPFAALLLHSELDGRSLHAVHVIHLTATPPADPAAGRQAPEAGDPEVLTPGRATPPASQQPVQELRPMGEAVRTP